MSKCDITYYAVPIGNYAFAPSRQCVKCNTHDMTDWTAPEVQPDLCPIGKIEKATDDGIQSIVDFMKDTLEIIRGEK